MGKAKYTISLMMAILFTAFIVFGTMPAEAVTKNTAAKNQVTLATAYVTEAENIVKTASFSVDLARTSVKLADTQVRKVYTYGKTYYASYNSLRKRLAAVTVKINARAKALADAQAALAEAKKVAAADAAVVKAEILSNTAVYDLMNDNSALENAKKAASTAVTAVNKLNKASTAYKNYTARINIVNSKILNIQREKEEAALVSIADNAVRAVETAPLVTYDDIAKVYELQGSAVSAIAKVRDSKTAADFTARLKVVTDKAAALKAQLDAAAIEAGTPAKLVSVSAVDGAITVSFNKKPITIISPADFKLTKSINGNITNVIITGISVVNDTMVVISVPYISSQPNVDQAVSYSVQYCGGNVMSTTQFIVPKLPVPYVTSVSVSDSKTILVAYSEAMDDNALDKRNYIIRDRNWNIAGTISSVGMVSGQGYVYKLKLSSALHGGEYTVIISNVISQNGVPITSTSKQITILENIPSSLGVSLKTAVTVQGKVPKAGTQNVQKVTINGSFASIPEKQVLSISNPGNPGQSEVNTVTVIGGPAVNTGALMIVFTDGVINTSINVPVTKGDNSYIIGSLIHSALINTPSINNSYYISDSNGVVTITAKTAAADKNVSILIYPIAGLNPGGDLSFKQTQLQAGSAPGLTAAGNIVLRVNNPSGSLIRTITIPISAGLNNVNVAAKIAYELKNYADITNQYYISASANTVIIQDKIVNQAVVPSALCVIDTGTTFLTLVSSVETQAPSSGYGTLIAYLGGSSVTIYLAPTDTTAALVASRVAMALNADAVIGSAYVSAVNGPVITITKRAAGYTTQCITLVNGTAKIPQVKVVTVTPGSNGTPGVNQVNTVTITAQPKYSGVLTISMNDGVVKQTINVGVIAGDSLSAVAQKIYGQLVYNSSIMSAYSIYVIDSKIIFTRKVPAAAQSFGFVIR